MKPNRQYFVVRIDRELQKKKKELIVLGGNGYLGIRHSEQEYKGSGVLLSGVEPDSPAMQAGLKGKDIIYAINSREVNSFEELVEQVSRYAPGEEVTLTIFNSLLITDPSQRQEKKVKLGKKEVNLEMPQTLRDMRHNLQFGEIIEIGSEAKAKFSHAKIGDILLFHHSVEYKSASDNDPFYNDMHLVDHDKQGNEIRIVHYEFEVFGVMKLTTPVQIIPHPRYVFCHYQIQKANIQRDQKSGLYLPDQWEQSIEELTQKIEELKIQEQEIMSSTVMTQRTTKENDRKQSEIRSVVKMLMQERAAITRKMHQKKMVETTVLFYNRESVGVLGYHLSPGDKILIDLHALYPLDILGTCYSLARTTVIEGALFLNKPPVKKQKKRTVMKELFNPLHDRVIVIPDEADDLSAGGLVIPDTAKERPAQGIVFACGPGLKDQPMQLVKGDYVLYSKYSGTEIKYKDELYVFLRESDILTAMDEGEKEKAIEENLRRKTRNAEIKEKLAQEEQSRIEENKKKEALSAPTINP